jgi:hypothetical protein
VNKIKNRVFGQQNIGSQWGIFAQVAGQLQIFMLAIILVINLISFYNTTVARQLLAYGVHLGMWTFVAFMAVSIGALVIVFIILYRFALPSYFAVWNEQFYRHNNPLKKDLAAIRKLLTSDLKHIKERLDKLEGK